MPEQNFPTIHRLFTSKIKPPKPQLPLVEPIRSKHMPWVCELAISHGEYRLTKNGISKLGGGIILGYDYCFRY